MFRVLPQGAKTKNREKAAAAVPAVPADSSKDHQPTQVKPEPTVEKVIKEGGPASAGNTAKRELDKTDEGEAAVATTLGSGGGAVAVGQW